MASELLHWSLPLDVDGHIEQVSGVTEWVPDSARGAFAPVGTTRAKHHSRSTLLRLGAILGAAGLLCSGLWLRLRAQLRPD